MVHNSVIKLSKVTYDKFNITLVYILITDYGELKLRDLRLPNKNISETWLADVNFRKLALLKFFLRLFTKDVFKSDSAGSVNNK